MAPTQKQPMTLVSTALIILLPLSLWVGSVSGCSGSTIGIDLGMSDSCCAVCNGKGQATVIPTDQGSPTMPSCVAFTDQGALVGEEAKDQAAANPEGTIVDIQRFIGKTIDDPGVQEEIENSPYPVVATAEGTLMVEVNLTGEPKLMSPTEITAMVVAKVKATAEASLGHPVKNAVVTVPAGFDEQQIQATKDACALAQLNSTAVITEPTAAAIAYGLDKKGKKKVLVYNLKGSSFDASVLSVNNRTIETLATSGDAHLGGQDFDKNVADHFAEVIKKRCGVDIANDTAALGKLTKECEKARKKLSCRREARVRVKSLVKGKDVCLTLTRRRFESLNAGLLKKTMDGVATAVNEAGIKKTDVDETIVAGGSAKMPKAEELLTEFCGGKAPMKGISPAVVAGCGAAIEAGNLEGGGDSQDILRVMRELESDVEDECNMDDDGDGCEEIQLDDV